MWNIRLLARLEVYVIINKFYKNSCLVFVCFINSVFISDQRFGTKVRRRYNDFVSLYDLLLGRFPYRLIPRLPPKKMNIGCKYHGFPLSVFFSFNICFGCFQNLLTLILNFCTQSWCPIHRRTASVAMEMVKPCCTSSGDKSGSYSSVLFHIRWGWHTA